MCMYGLLEGGEGGGGNKSRMRVDVFDAMLLKLNAFKGRSSK
jgi:hypothetical protein